MGAGLCSPRRPKSGLVSPLKEDATKRASKVGPISRGRSGIRGGDGKYKRDHCILFTTVVFQLLRFFYWISINQTSTNTFNMRSAVISTAAFALGAFAQSSSTTSMSSGSDNTASATLWGDASAVTDMPGLDGVDIDYKLNVVDADNCKTTYNLIGSAPQLGLDEAQTVSGHCYIDLASHTNLNKITIVQGKSDYDVKYGLSTAGNVISLTETCQFSGTTQASCSNSVTLSLKDLTSTATSGTTTVTDLMSTVIPIATGGEKLASATGTCTSPGNAAAATGVADVYKVVVVPAAAAIAAALI